TARKHIPRTDNFIILNMETKGAKPFPKSPIYCFLNHSAERILVNTNAASVAHARDSSIPIVSRVIFPLVSFITYF
ncbi:MAG: hypothetical protein ACR5K5_06275, partial [Wolbachia sp.]